MCRVLFEYTQGNPVALLAPEAEIARWQGDGLPDDVVSVQNGSIVTYTQRWPLMVDPQLQGIRWVKTMEERRGLVVGRLDQPDLVYRLMRAVEEGTPFLIEV